MRFAEAKSHTSVNAQKVFKQKTDIITLSCFSNAMVGMQSSIYSKTAKYAFNANGHIISDIFPTFKSLYTRIDSEYIQYKAGKSSQSVFILYL